MYTEFDWRIGILNGQALYACQYFMSRGHWQIYNHAAKGNHKASGQVGRLQDPADPRGAQRSGQAGAACHRADRRRPLRRGSQADGERVA
jgi:hypothetical protein